MCLPVTCVNVCVLDGVAAVDHHIVSDVDAHMGSSGGIISSFKENQITGTNIGAGYPCTDTAQALSSQSADIPSDTAVVDYP